MAGGETDRRSPGYPVLAVPARTSEQALLPPQPLPLRQIFFQDLDPAPRGGLFRWSIIAAMLLGSYG